MYFIVNKLGLYYCGECWSGCSIWKSHVSRGLPFSTKQSAAKYAKDVFGDKKIKIKFKNQEKYDAN